MKIIILLIVTLVQSIIAMCTSSFDIKNTISSSTQQKAEECKVQLLQPVNKTNEKQKS